MADTETSHLTDDQNQRYVVERLVSQLVSASLPLWSSEGWDRTTGSFIERLTHAGKADVAQPRRIRVQARQIYSFAKAAQMGWYPEGEAIALMGLRFMLKHARAPDGKPGYVHILNTDGSVKDPRRDTYDHAFVLLALSTVFAITKDDEILSEIDSTMRFLNEDMCSPDGGYLESLPPALPRRQNPHMHLFEAMISLYDATAELRFRDHAGEMFKLFAVHFYDASSRTLGEYFENNLSPILPAIVEPGHQAEWVWLLRAFERITGCPTGSYRSALIESALRHSDSSGCLIDEVDRSGNVTKSTRRLWPQTEIAKAWIAQAQSGETGAHQQALKALIRLERYYLSHPVAGGWYDQFDQSGRSQVHFIPASSFYHVICAIAEAAHSLPNAAAYEKA